MASAPVTYDSSTGMALGETEREYSDQVSVLACQGCRQNTVVIEEKCVGGVRARDGRGSGLVQWRGTHWWPTPGMHVADPDVPAPVADAVAEGSRCLAVQSPRAAAVTFRGALALIVQEKGSAAAQAKTNLKGQLDHMAADGDLDKTLAEWADQVRVIGNAGAHPGTLDPVTMEEAHELSRLVASLLDYLYRTPARIQRARTARP